MTKIKFEASRVNEVALKASADARTVLKVAEGRLTKGMVFDRIMKALAALGLGLALLVVGCDGAGLTVEVPDAPPSECHTWGVVGEIGPHLGERICIDGQPVAPCHAGEVDHCRCSDGTYSGYQTCGDAGVLNACMCQ